MPFLRGKGARPVLPDRAGQTDFATALLDPAKQTPAGVVAPGGRPSEKRFAVYRNNVMVSLLEALAATYASVQALVGETFFREISRQFVRQSPPKNPVLYLYGEAFPEFLEGLEVLHDLPFIGDVARCDWAWLQAYHAADAPVLTAEQVEGMPGEKLVVLQWEPHPAAHLVRSVHPMVSLWHAGRQGSHDAGIDPRRSESALIVRPEWDVQLYAVDAATAAFFEELMNSKPLGVAAEAGLAVDQAFDLQGALRLALRSGAFAS